MVVLGRSEEEELVVVGVGDNTLVGSAFTGLVDWINGGGGGEFMGCAVDADIVGFNCLGLGLSGGGSGSRPVDYHS